VKAHISPSTFQALDFPFFAPFPERIFHRFLEKEILRALNFIICLSNTKEIALVRLDDHR
jgi:CRISPR/Cas system endoribonuclease Cas6 (RAMP superfamily)